jgi:outer membrane protein TolC
MRLFDPEKDHRRTRCSLRKGHFDGGVLLMSLKWFFLFLVFLMLIPISPPSVYPEEITEETLSPAVVLPMREALAAGIEHNLNLIVTQLFIPIRTEDEVVSQAEFDPVVDASLFGRAEKILTASAFQEVPFSRSSQIGGDAGIRKRFEFGLLSRLSLQSFRTTDNSRILALDPQYRNLLILDLTQPILRDFGTEFGTTGLRVARNQVDQAVYGYVNRAQQLGQEIEILYIDLAVALEVFRYRIESRELARSLLAGNREKYRLGVVSISEVQEAETAVAAREEEVLSALQRVEIISNSLKDLLEIGPVHPLFAENIKTEEMPGIDQIFPDLEQAIAIAFEKRPDLYQQQLAVVNSDILLSFYRNQRLPRLDLEATMGLNGLSGAGTPVIPITGGEPGRSPLEGNYFDSLSRMAEGDGYQWYAGLRFSYPLGNRAAKSRYERSRLEKRQAIYVLKRLEGSVETEVKNALVTVQRSLERVKVAERTMNLASKTLQQENYRLQEGLSDTFRILRFQDDLISAQISKVAALSDFNRGLANLYRAMGTNLERLDIMTEFNPQGPPPAG